MAQALAGWAASFGTYDSADKAQMALRGRALNPCRAERQVAASRASSNFPTAAASAPVIWGLDQGKSASVCAQYKQDGAHCDVLPAVLMDKIAHARQGPQGGRRGTGFDRAGGGRRAKAGAADRPLTFRMMKPAHLRGVLLALAAASIYGAVPNFARMAFLNGVPALESVLSRTAVVAAGLGLVALLRARKLPPQP